MKGFILFIIATVTVPVFNIIGMVFTLFYYLVTFRWLEASGDYERIAIAKDQLSNVVMKHLFDLLMINARKQVIWIDDVSVEAVLKVSRFGYPGITISTVFGYNKFAGRLTRFGRFWARFLNRVDKLHVEDALKAELKKYE